MILNHSLQTGLNFLSRALLGLLGLLALGAMFWRGPVESKHPITAMALLVGLVTLLILLERITAKKHIQSKAQPENSPQENAFFDEATNLEEPEDAEILLEEGVSQQIVRRRTADGSDCLEGTFCVQFPVEWPAKTQQVTIHVPFCPAFQTVPRVETFLLDDAAAKIQSSNVYPHGVAVDVRRDSMDVAMLHFCLTATENQS